MNDFSIPTTNLEAYQLLYSIENVLRELIIECLSSLAGPRWYIQRLPGDSLTKYREAKSMEKKIKWTRLIPHHPVYYLDFPDLKKIISSKNNWKDAFEHIFSRQDLLDAHLSEIEGTRNNLAHNREISPEELHILENTKEKLIAALGTQRFELLMSRCTQGCDLRQTLSFLADEAKEAFGICNSFAPPLDLVRWQAVKSAWWFDETYLSVPLSPINSYFQILEEYARFPRRVGSGYKLEQWLTSIPFATLYAEASNLLIKLLEEDGK